MISLKTLPNATAQEVFDQVARHLLTQKKRSSNRMTFRYHHGCLKCAAGCLISDDEYKEIFEGKDWKSLVQNGYVSSVHADLIQELQEIHDQFQPSRWLKKLKKVAIKYNLSSDAKENQ